MLLLQDLETLQHGQADDDFVYPDIEVPIQVKNDSVVVDLYSVPPMDDAEVSPCSLAIWRQDDLPQFVHSKRAFTQEAVLSEVFAQSKVLWCKQYHASAAHRGMLMNQLSYNVEPVHMYVVRDLVYRSDDGVRFTCYGLYMFRGHVDDGSQGEPLAISTNRHILRMLTMSLFYVSTSPSISTLVRYSNVMDYIPLGSGFLSSHLELHHTTKDRGAGRQGSGHVAITFARGFDDVIGMGWQRFIQCRIPTRPRDCTPRMLRQELRSMVDFTTWPEISKMSDEQIMVMVLATQRAYE